MLWFRRLFKRDKPKVERGPDWRIVTPYSAMEGTGMLPWSLVHEMRSRGVVVQTWFDGTGDGLPPFERNRHP